MIARIYGSLPGARISTKIIKRQIASGRWYTGYGNRPEQGNDWFSELKLPKDVRAHSFACIGLFETGDTDLQPETLHGLMALSTGDSIYLAAPLLCDPCETIRPWEVKRVFGSVGRPGLSLLFSPPAPMVCPQCLDAWHLITHDDYDGRAADSFANTSLHLSLTDYRVPFTNAHEGVRDIETFFQEAVVSVYDGREWVGDVDILKSLEQSTHKIHKLVGECPHLPEDVCLDASFRRPAFANSSKKSAEDTKIHATTLSTVDNWHELLDRPKNAVVARADNNWLARLAIVALAVHQGCRVFVVSKPSCDVCFSNPYFIKEWTEGEDDVVVY
ncbi:hypothetical protein GJ744_012433 [Endocarpon pusillum]|uniref:Uncharacterized protein n=1 Tax=Endocarpon pusillum TaxID=364733 RepID=A0A8H7ABQ2_9EURO|nr:hypothetical protein GJ744_012433 [Endocarpon pusillum]